MFTSIIDTTAGTISIQSAMICIGAALVLGIISALVYMLSAERYSSNFILTMALLPALVQVVILMTSGNLGSAVAVLGTFSLIRFRSAAGTAKELLGIFFSMAIGLACGMGQIVFAVIITLVISLMLFLLTKLNFGGRHGDEKVLKITIPEDLDYTEIFDDIFAKYTTTAKLQKVKTVNLGSMYELDYDVMLKDKADDRRYPGQERKSEYRVRKARGGYAGAVSTCFFKKFKQGFSEIQFPRSRHSLQSSFFSGRMVQSFVLLLCLHFHDYKCLSHQQREAEDPGIGLPCCDKNGNGQNGKYHAGDPLVFVQDRSVKMDQDQAAKAV